jgi:hypothetical protein
MVALVTLAVSGCNKDKKDDDPKEIIPVVLDFRGPQDVAASGLEVLEYKVAFRAGSKYEFTPVGWPADVTVPDTAYPNVVMVRWYQSSVDTAAWLVCVETSATGNVSEPDSLPVKLRKFCPWTLEDFVGTWKGTETGDSDTSLTVNIEIDTLHSGNVLRVKAAYQPNDSGGVYEPPFLKQVFQAWGERFVPEKGNEGDVLLYVNLTRGTILIENDYQGKTLPGENYYWTGGKGTWCGCVDSININYELYWSTDFSKPKQTCTVRLKKEE